MRDAFFTTPAQGGRFAAQRQSRFDQGPRVLVADDNPAMLETVVSLLAPDFDVVGVVSDGKAALEAAVQLQPEVAVLDISMPRHERNPSRRTYKRKRELFGPRLYF